MIFCSSCTCRTTRRIRGRAVKALRSGRSQLCWRGFESHRMQHLFCFFVDYDSFPSDSWLGGLHQLLQWLRKRGLGSRRSTRIYTGHPTTSVGPRPPEDIQKAFKAEPPPSQPAKQGLWRYRDSSPGQADHNRLC
jgi:hypothetical protein